MVSVSNDLGGSSSSRGQGCVVAKSAVVTAGGCSDEFLWPLHVLPFHPSGQFDAFADLHCLNSYIV